MNLKPANSPASKAQQKNSAWQRFRANRRGFFSFLIFLFLYLLSLCAELITNDQPIFVRTAEGRLLFPCIQRSIPQNLLLKNGSALPITDWQKATEKTDTFLLFPPLRSGANTVFSAEELDPFLRPKKHRSAGIYPAAALWLNSAGTVTRSQGKRFPELEAAVSNVPLQNLSTALSARFQNQTAPAFEITTDLASYRLPAYTPRAAAPAAIRIDVRPPDWRTAPPRAAEAPEESQTIYEPAVFPFRPIPGHPFGFDATGHDVFARVLYATRIAITFGLALTFASLLLGIFAGGIQGYFAGWTDLAGQRFTEIFSAIPFLYVMIFLGNTLGRSFALLLFCYALFNWIGVAAYVRAEFLRLRTRPFVDAARCQGLSSARIILGHILPNALTPLITLFPFMLVGAIGALAALDYLGFGLPDTIPSWGELLQQAQSFRSAWWLIFFPSATLFLVILLGVFIGEGLRDAFDPRSVSVLDAPPETHRKTPPTAAENAPDPEEPLLCIRNLSVSFESPAGEVRAVEGLNLSLNPGETLALVGESGCGKSVFARSVLRLVPSPPGRLRAGSIRFDGQELSSLPLPELRKLRGAAVGMVFQDPMTALSPLHRIGDQLVEALRLHNPSCPRKKALQIASGWLARCGIADPERCLREYPFRLSGGMQQRVMIASVLMTKPRLIIADEPTTALDVTIQAQVLELMKNARDAETALLLITHNMGVVRSICSRVAVMYAGSIVESGTVEEVFRNPRHPYTAALLDAMPSRHAPGERLPAIPGAVPSPCEKISGCRFRPRCPYAKPSCAVLSPEAITAGSANHQSACPYREEINASTLTPAPPVPLEAPAASAASKTPRALLQVNNLSRFYPHVRALSNVSLQLFEGETLAIVGESGSGKTTLARILMGLEKASSGSVFFEGKKCSMRRPKTLRTTMQMVFQDPFSSLNPSKRIATQLTEAAIAQKRISPRERIAFAGKLLAMVGLPPEAAGRLPHEFSGGQLQRISIARALSLSPRILLCDEPVSALDVSVQAQVLNLLADLRKEQNLSCIFITHDLGVVRSIADRIAVLHKGKLVEIGPAQKILTAPEHPYTKILLASEPRL